MTAAQILALRKSQGLTQEAFTEAWGLNVKTYRDWEAGAREPKGPALLWLLAIEMQPIAARKVVAAFRSAQ